MYLEEEVMIMRRSRNHRLAAFTPAVLLALTIGIGACDEDGDIDLINPPPGGVVGTVAAFADTTVAFNEFNTFAMPDTVVHFDPLTGTPLAVPRTYDQVILDRVRANFIGRGYVEELNPDSVAPDFIVLVGATATANRAAFLSYSWFSTWGFYDGLRWYAPGFDNTWTVIYPCCANATVVTYPRGTLIVDLIPTGPQINPLNRTVSSAWLGVATNAVGTRTTAATITAAIDQMFVLSPYLRSDTLIVNPL
jgi:hypothetical protein